MKRVLSLGLVMTIMICALLTFMPVTAATIVNNGTFGANGNNLTWTLDDKGVLTISGVGSMGITSEDSEIPWRDVRRSISSVVIEYGVTDVGVNAFESWSDTLTNVSLPNSIKSIESGAFSYCYGLTNINIPDSVTLIDSNAFMMCTKLQSVKIGNGVTSIGTAAFYSCNKLTDVTVGSSVKIIGERAFVNCKSLAKIEIPDSVESICSEAFLDCSALKNITIGSGVTSISFHAFYNTEYYNNKNNWINGILYIGSYLIDTDLDITECIIKEGTTCIADIALKCYEIKTLTIPASVISIGSSAFDFCYNLTDIYVSEKNQHFRSESGVLFDKNMTALIKYPAANTKRNYMIPNSVAFIKDYAFNECSNLLSVTIPHGVTSIQYSAFQGCRNLKCIEIPNSVISVDRFAFYNCDSLSDIYYGGNKSEWQAIEINSNNDSLLNAAIHYNSTMPGGATPTPKPTPTQKPAPTPTTKPTADPNTPSVEIIEVRNGFVTAKVNNCDDTDAQVILAVYNKNGALIEMQKYYNFGDVTFFSANLQNANIKVMLWSNTDNIKPLAETAEMSL